jgi:two-component system NarL family response regulator
MLIDDHTLFLEGLRNLLLANGLEVIGTVNSGLKALLKVEELQPDVILMDIQMPEMDGIEVTRIIKSKYPSIKIIMLTVSQDNQHLFEAIKSGASGYLLKGMEKEKFLEQLKSIAHGESPLSSGLAAKILAEFARIGNERNTDESSNQKLLAHLTPRQVETLKLVAQGFTYKEVGGRLDITEAAVKYHMGEITSKLHLENRAQAVAYAAEIGLLKKIK